eukprot:TRINITY_DN618_c0_g1_i1.p1 TRINITY_DN618_c0_g1~~TRINITY_DN618_c0_g1_i1.p1  ORF type:complete len:234 (+),score=22.83 TRINITY_DN618_c0_g1_i1:56-757(+)
MFRLVRSGLSKCIMAFIPPPTVVRTSLRYASSSTPSTPTPTSTPKSQKKHSEANTYIDIIPARPAFLKHKRNHVGRVKSVDMTDIGKQIPPGQYGLLALQSGRITDAQFGAIRAAISKPIKASNTMITWRLSPNIACTKKPLNTRMGKGKGPISHYIAQCPAGSILFHLSTSLTPTEVVKILNQVKLCLPIRTRLVYAPIPKGIDPNIVARAKKQQAGSTQPSVQHGLTMVYP